LHPNQHYKLGPQQTCGLVVVVIIVVDLVVVVVLLLTAVKEL
jgi:hypothetical protein